MLYQRLGVGARVTNQISKRLYMELIAVNRGTRNLCEPPSLEISNSITRPKRRNIFYQYIPVKDILIYSGVVAFAWTKCRQGCCGVNVVGTALPTLLEKFHKPLKFKTGRKKLQCGLNITLMA